MNDLLKWLLVSLIVGTLAACGGLPLQSRAPVAPAPSTAPSSASTAPLSEPRPAFGESATAQGPVRLQARSRWAPVAWSDLPGWQDDPLHEAWNAWLKSCERPGPTFAPLCAEVRRLSLGSGNAQRDWMMARLQPYRVEALQGGAGDSQGLLTGYYEPVLEGSRVASAEFAVPLYRTPANLAQRKPWYTRQEIDTQPAVQALLRGREIAYLANPVDALVLQIQGSGRVRVTEANGTQRLIRMAFAGSNDQPYKSVGRWLLDQGALRDASWPSIKNWIAQNPGRVNEMLWSNPRVVFFREETLSDLDAAFGPRGAQGVALTPGRSIAVDPGSIPYGTPVWLASSGPQVQLQKLVMAQDTGSAITGAVRADYFTGWDANAAELAGRLKQPLRLWVLWPR